MLSKPLNASIGHLPDISGAHGHDQVAGLHVLFEIVANAGESVNEDGLAPIAVYPLDQHLRVDLFLSRL
jgi:hypothetical protein